MGWWRIWKIFNLFSKIPIFIINRQAPKPLFISGKGLRLFWRAVTTGWWCLRGEWMMTKKALDTTERFSSNLPKRQLNSDYWLAFHSKYRQFFTTKNAVVLACLGKTSAAKRALSAPWRGFDRLRGRGTRLLHLPQTSIRKLYLLMIKAPSVVRNARRRAGKGKSLCLTIPARHPLKLYIAAGLVDRGSPDPRRLCTTLI